MPPETPRGRDRARDRTVFVVFGLLLVSYVAILAAVGRFPFFDEIFYKSAGREDRDVGDEEEPEHDEDGPVAGPVATPRGLRRHAPPREPGPVNAAVKRALAKEPRDRFASGGELARALEAVHAS